MRRKRRSHGTWFPMLGAETLSSDLVIRHNRKTAIVVVQGNLKPTTVVFPLTFDNPQEQSSGQALDQTLAEIVGSEYICKRVLGSLLVGIGNAVPVDPEEADQPWAVDVTAGFFVARAADQETAPGGSEVPIGYAPSQGDEITTYNIYGPGATDTIREPWMWRRSWLLTPPGVQPFPAQTFITSGENSWPWANWQYNQLNLGATVDIKSRRRVSQDDRLWLAISTQVVVGAQPAELTTIDTNITASWDLRLFGQLVKAKNSGNF